MAPDLTKQSVEHEAYDKVSLVECFHSLLWCVDLAFATENHLIILTIKNKVILEDLTQSNSISVLVHYF